MTASTIPPPPPPPSSAAVSVPATKSRISSWRPSSQTILRGPQLLLTGPRLLLRGPRLLLRAPVAVLRAPGTVRAGTRRLFSSSRQRRNRQHQQQHQQQSQNTNKNPNQASTDAGPSNESFTSRLRKRLSSTPTTWYPIPVSLGIAVLVVVNFYKGRSWETTQDDEQGQQDGKGKGKGKVPATEEEIKVKGPWQVHVLGALPLRSISRLYGLVNSYTLPVWFRVPGYKLYAFIFGVNLDECEPSDLREYRSMSEFFMRKLKPGVRPIAQVQLVSPADGKVVNFGSVDPAGRVEQVKGSTYSVDALLSGTGQVDQSFKQPFVAHRPHPHQTEYASVDEEEFANLNGIAYSLDELIGADKASSSSVQGGGSHVDASLSEKERSEENDAPKRSMSGDASVALEVAKGNNNLLPWSSDKVPREGNKLFFTVIYLAPGDYHRFHSPTSWVVERRRHFAGELFSVSPWMANKLQDLFVLNERVALLGKWRHGFFSMVPVGATNVGSIRVNFDSSLRTNSPLRPITPNTYSEATYAKASSLLRGQPLHAGDEVGGFWLGSTIVLVFEAPKEFEFSIKLGQKVKVGEAMGDCPK
ncbi:phosphatidylserine decarboxylase [Meredithblackwellia eburnea MCA 4105]